MKGLIRNNFYTAEGSIKMTLIISIIIMTVTSIMGKGRSFLISSVIAANLGAFGGLSTT